MIALSEMPPLPPHLEPLDKSDYLDNRFLAEETWHHFEPCLVSRGYRLLWSTESGFGRVEKEGEAVNLEQQPAKKHDSPPSEESIAITKNIRKSCQCSFHAGFDITRQMQLERANVIIANDMNGRKVVIKALHDIRGKRELDIITFLNSPLLRSKPHNHTISILDQFKTEEWNFIVMPYWPAPCHGQLVVRHVDDCFNLLIQALEGLQFMHEHGIVHRDISRGNLVLNYEVRSKSQAECDSLQHEPLTLAFIDFGNAERCEGLDSSSWESSTGAGTYECTAPEMLRLFDPEFVEPDPASAPKDVPRTFKLVPTDVYALGAAFMNAFTETRESYAFLQKYGYAPSTGNPALEIVHVLVPQYFKLFEEMTHSDPIQRPSVVEVLEKCRQLRDGLHPAIRFSPEGGYPDMKTLRTSAGIQNDDADQCGNVC